jgi:hypothetical protein
MQRMTFPVVNGLEHHCMPRLHIVASWCVWPRNGEARAK